MSQDKENRLHARKLAIISFALLPVLSGCSSAPDTLAEAGDFDEVSEITTEEPAPSEPVEPVEPVEPPLPWDDLEPFDPGRRVRADLEDLLPDITEFSYGGEGWVLGEGDEGLGGDSSRGPDGRECYLDVDYLIEEYEAGFADTGVTQEIGDSFTAVYAGILRYADPRIVRHEIERKWTRVEEACILRSFAAALGGVVVDFRTETYEFAAGDPRLREIWLAEALLSDGEFELPLLMVVSCTGVGDTLACVYLLETGGWEGWVSSDADHMRPLLAMQSKMLSSLELAEQSPGA